MTLIKIEGMTHQEAQIIETLDNNDFTTGAFQQLEPDLESYFVDTLHDDYRKFHDILSERKGSWQETAAERYDAAVKTLTLLPEPTRGTKVSMAKVTMDKQIAESAGILADLNTMDGDSSAFGSGGIIGCNEEEGDEDCIPLSKALGGLIGSQYGEQYGSGGLGSRGSGYGGGGTASGLGDVRTTREHGLFTPTEGSGGGYFGRKGGRTNIVNVTEKSSTGPIQEMLIDNVIRRHLNQIRYCYQRVLNEIPDLEGNVSITFIIDQSGVVTSTNIDSSSLNNEEVETCLCSRFDRFSFPEKPDEGTTTATYTFTFKPSD